MGSTLQPLVCRNSESQQDTCYQGLLVISLQASPSGTSFLFHKNTPLFVTKQPSHPDFCTSQAGHVTVQPLYSSPLPLPYSLHAFLKLWPNHSSSKQTGAAHHEVGKQPVVHLYCNDQNIRVLEYITVRAVNRIRSQRIQICFKSPKPDNKEWNLKPKFEVGGITQVVKPHVRNKTGLPLTSQSEPIF